jgi:outer membrane cobalamin receptor
MASPPQRQRSTLWLLSLATLAACAGARGRAAPVDPATGAQLITEEQIKQSGATNAWDALRRAAPHLQLTEGASGQPAKMKRRGRSSVILDDTPEVFLDGVKVADFRSLAQIPAHTISTITILSGIEGSTHYGTNAGNGVILIRTKTQ